MRILTVLGLAAVVSACERIPQSARLDRLATELHARATLECSPPHFEDASDPLTVRLYRVCSREPRAMRPNIDTVVVISEDSLGHALSVTRLWHSEHRPSDYAMLRDQLVREHGEPTRCANETGVERWNDEELAIAIDSMSPGSIGFRLWLGLDRPICAATPCRWCGQRTEAAAGVHRGESRP